jgi:DNA-binding SARP family transcriptional activator
MDHPGEIEFRLLGPLEVHRKHGPVALGPPQQRALLALLLLNANRVVSRDRLIDELWGEQPPATATKLVHVYVSRLRKALEPDRGHGEEGLILVTRSPGYLLAVEVDQLDLGEFERLRDEAREAVAAGDPEEAARKLREALALWRGPPLADLGYESFAQAELARLEELHLTAQEDLFDAELALGRHLDLVGELESFARRHPVRERARAQLMLALYRSGRQAEALEAYQDARKALTEELGIEPSRELRELQQAILEQDPTLDRSPAKQTPAERPTGEAPPGAVPGFFVGRGRELAELEAALEGATGGRGRLALLVGEPGIGKSRLAEELMAKARVQGAEVIVGRCWEAGGAPAYWPWVQSLRAHIRETDAETLRSQLGAGAADLAQLFPELRELIPELGDPPPLESEGARFRLFEATSKLLRSAAEVRPLVLMLDDLHAADEPTLLLLQFVAREIADSRVLAVCAFRDVDPTMREPLVSTLAALVREPHTTQIALTGLSDIDVAEYIELSTGVQPTPRLVEAIHAETEGSPLFVAETVRLLDAEGQIADSDAQMRIPPGIRAVIDQRVGRLPERCRSLLVPAAVMGREFELEALTRLSGLAPGELLDELDVAMSERILGDLPGSPGRLRFGHALIRDTLYDELTPARRMQLHREVADALAEAHSEDLGPHLSELAHHYLAAAPAGAADHAVEYARRAGDRAASQLAHEEAARLYQMALSLVEESTERCDLLLALGDVQARAGDSHASKQANREAAELAEKHGLSEHLARAALGYGGRFIWHVSRDDAFAVQLHERAIDALGDANSPLRVRLLARFAAGPLRDASFSPARRHELSEEALEAARRLDDPATLVYALSAFIAAHHSPDFTPRQVPLATELIGAATEAGEPERWMDGHEYRFTALIELGDMQGAKADLAMMANLAEELRQPSHDWFVAVYRAALVLLEGELAAAEELISAARRMGERAQSWSAAVGYGLQLYLLRREQGRIEKVEDLVRRSAEEYLTYPIWRCALAQMAAQTGRIAEAREALNQLGKDEFADLPFDEEWLVCMSLLAETSAALGDTGHASILYRRLLPYGDRVAFSYAQISLGSISRYLGILAAVAQRWEEAERHFEAALEMNRRIGARSWLAHTQADYARMLSARAEGDDAERAIELARRALEGYRNLGMDSYAAEATRLERAVRADPAPQRNS